MVGVRVAVLFIGLMRIADKAHIQSIVTSTQDCDTFVITYGEESSCGTHFTQNNESRLLIIPQHIIKYVRQLFCTNHIL